MRLLYWILAWAVLATGPARAESTVRYAPPAAWVVVDQVKHPEPTPPGDVSYGYDYLLLDNQVSVRDQAAYSHSVYRVTAEGALQSASRLSLDFDPDYQELTIHHLRVTRDGQTEDRLKTTKAKIIQQERDLDRHMLNGELTALFVLEDIRVGDVVDYAFTRRGWNPAFDKRYFSRVSVEWAVPVRVQKFRLVAPPDRVPAVKPHGPTSNLPSQTKLGQDVVLTWIGGGFTPIAEESETPDWYEAYSSMQFSEFTTWAQVVRWAEPLYALPNPIPEPVRVQAEKLTHGIAKPEDRAVALLQFVQQEIRYLGMELGAGSYRPTPPEVVLARRFGDCKDKTMLYCALMRAVGLKAEPALLQTTYGHRIKDWLPTPHAFDHVIAVVTLNGNQHWVDPTLTYQQGALGTRGLPVYGTALIVRPGNEIFTAISQVAAGPEIVNYEETFDIPGFDQPARFQVRTTFTGMRANATRREFAQNTPAELSKSYVNYYASVYPGLTAVAPPRMSEDKARNIVTVEESYTVPNLWKTPASGAGLEAEFFPKPILDLADRPTTTVRTTPLEISSPASSTLITTVNLPEDWHITPGNQSFVSDAFVGSVGITGQGRKVVMKYSWDSRADHIEADQVAKHVKTLNQFRDTLGYTLTYKKPAAAAPAPAAALALPPQFRLNWMLVLVTLVTLTLGLLGVRAVMARYPRKLPPPEQPGLEPPVMYAPVKPALTGIGGWLYLVAIKVTIAPFTILASSIIQHRRFFNQDEWDPLTTPGGDAYHAWLGPLLVAEIAVNLLQVIGAVWLMALFYRRHRLFPVLFIFTLSFALVLLVGDTWAAGKVVTSAKDESGLPDKEMIQLVVHAAIWIPYMLVSRRVKLTFTK